MRDFLKKCVPVMLLALGVFSLAGCGGGSDGEDEIVVSLKISGLDAPFDANADAQSYAQELSIVCNSDWRISGIPSWLNVSASSGTGNFTVKVWPNAKNDTERENVAELVVVAGDKMVTKSVRQSAGVDANLTVTPNKVVVLANSVGLDFVYGSNVTYYKYTILPASQVERYTDAEIISSMASIKRDTPSDNFVSGKTGLSASTDYVICVVAFDSKGNNGKLVKVPFKTKSSSNQAIATISNVGYNATQWTWTTTISGFTTKYYMWNLSDLDFNYNEGVLAWLFKERIESNPDDCPPIANGSTWNVARNGTHFDVATWGVDINNELAGVIVRKTGDITAGSRQIGATRMNSFEVEKVSKYLFK